MNTKTLLSTAVLVALGSLAGCGGGGSGSGSTQPGAQVTGVVSRVDSPANTGVIAGAAAGDNTRLTVNGVTYTLDDDADIEVEDAPGDESHLAEGQVVTMSTATDGDGTNLVTALSIEDEVEGVVFEVDLPNHTLNVMGQTVSLAELRKFESDDAAVPTLDDLAAGNVVEVSGYPSADGIVATRIEVKAADYMAYDDEFELKGVITAAGADSVEIGGQIIETDANTELDDMPGDRSQWTGLYVEVKATNETVVAADQSILATEIEREDDASDGDDGDEVEIEGVLDYSGGEVSINGRTVQVSDRISPETLAGLDGRLVEVEGHYVNGELVIDHIELEDDD
jgi:hypothetical protein